MIPWAETVLAARFGMELGKFSSLVLARLRVKGLGFGHCSHHHRLLLQGFVRHQGNHPLHRLQVVTVAHTRDPQRGLLCEAVVGQPQPCREDHLRDRWEVGRHRNPPMRG